MKRAALITLATMLALGTIAGVGYAVGNRFNKMTPAQKADMIANRIVKELDLTAAQQKKLNAMKAELVDKITRLHEDRSKVKGEVLALVRSDRVTERDINRLIDQREAKWQEFRPVVVDMLVDFHSMLTPEQRNKLAEKMESFHKGNGCHHME